MNQKTIFLLKYIIHHKIQNGMQSIRRLTLCFCLSMMWKMNFLLNFSSREVISHARKISMEGGKIWIWAEMESIPWIINVFSSTCLHTNIFQRRVRKYWRIHTFVSSDLHFWYPFVTYRSKINFIFHICRIIPSSVSLAQLFWKLRDLKSKINILQDGRWL